LNIGQYQRLVVGRETLHGVYLRDEGGAEVLLPKGQVPRGTRIGDELDVFLYTDSEDRLIATTKKPVATVGEFAVMRCVGESRDGAFLDWGIDKDLFCAVREQRHSMRRGESYLVRVYLDEYSDRVAASTKINRFLEATPTGFDVGQRVEIIVAERLRDFITAIIDNRSKGMLFPDEWAERLEVGDRRTAYVKQVREDGKLALSLRPQGYAAVLGERSQVLKALDENGGFLALSDKSSPEEIFRAFGLSKGAYKKLIGTLFKEGLITIESGGIRARRPAGE
jgi:predicted RNA-binding protein (virulence factor B family)